MKIELTPRAKQAYQDNFPNGSYVEGFTFLTADEGVSLSRRFSASMATGTA